MNANYVARHAHRRDNAVVSFLTHKSLFRKITAVFNAAAADMALARTNKLKQCFNTLTVTPHPQGARASAQFVHKLYKRSKSIPSWRAALQIIYKAKTHFKWEKLHKNKRLKSYSKVFNEVVNEQIGLENKHAVNLGADNAYSSRLDRFTPGLDGDAVMRWTHKMAAAKPKLQKKARQRHILFEGIKNHNMPEIPHDAGLRIILRIYRDLGIDENTADIHFASHPMCFEGQGRPQILLRKDYNSFFSAVMDAVHEAGHALYRIHMNDTARVSMMGLIETDYAGVDEAMAMLFDQNLALTPQFATYLSEIIMDECENEIGSFYTPEMVFKGINASKYGLCRVRSGPEQYALFMAQLGELERDLLTQSITPQQLPKEWRALSFDWHGIYPDESDLKESVFQDPHWSLGEIGRFSGGYFPGMLMAAQIFDTMFRDNPSALNGLQNGDFSAVMDWCRDKLYQQPRRAHYNEFLQKATGRTLDVDIFLSKAQQEIAFPKACQSLYVKNVQSLRP